MKIYAGFYLALRNILILNVIQHRTKCCIIRYEIQKLENEIVFY